MAQSGNAGRSANSAGLGRHEVRGIAAQVFFLLTSIQTQRVLSQASQSHRHSVFTHQRWHRIVHTNKTNANNETHACCLVNRLHCRVQYVLLPLSISSLVVVAVAERPRDSSWLFSLFLPGLWRVVIVVRDEARARGKISQEYVNM